MSRRDGSVYVGRLSKSTRTRDLEEIFEPYGRLMRCDIKYGSEMAYAFIDFEDRRDAELISHMWCHVHRPCHWEECSICGAMCIDLGIGKNVLKHVNYILK